MIKINKSPYLKSIIVLIFNAVSYIAMGLTYKSIQFPVAEVSAGNIVERAFRYSHEKLHELKGICVGSRVYFDR